MTVRCSHIVILGRSAVVADSNGRLPFLAIRRRVSGCRAGRGNEASDMSRNWRFLGTARAVIGAMFQEPVSPVSPGTFLRWPSAGLDVPASISMHGCNRLCNAVLCCSLHLEAQKDHEPGSALGCAQFRTAAGPANNLEPPGEVVLATNSVRHLD